MMPIVRAGARRAARLAGALTGRPAVLALVLALALVLVLVGLVAALAPTVIAGARFGRLLESQLPKTEGTIRVGSGSWTWGAAWELWRGRPAPFALDDVRLLDPEGTEVFRALRLTGSLQVDTDPLRIGVHGLRVEKATWRFASMRARREIGFLAALSPMPETATGRSPTAPTPAAGGTAAILKPVISSPGCQDKARPCFRIFDAHLEGLDAAFVFPEWQLALRDVHTTGTLAYDWSRGARPEFAFEVQRADVRGGGQLGVRVGSTALMLPLTRAWLNRVATNASAPHAIVIDAAPVVIGRSKVTFAATFAGVYGNGGPQPPAGMNAVIRIDEGAGDAVQEALASLLRGGDHPAAASARPGVNVVAAAVPVPVPVVSGAAARLALSLSGPFSDLIIEGKAHGFQVRYRDFELRDLGLRAWGQASAGRARVDGLSITSPGGGTVALIGEVRDGLARATATFQQFSVGAFLPPMALPFAAGKLDGLVRGHVELARRHLTLDDVALSLVRPEDLVGPSVIRIGRPSPPPSRPATRGARPGLVDGTILLPDITAFAWGGRVTVGGSIALAGTPLYDMTINARRIAVEQLVGFQFLHGPVSFKARGRGSLQKLAVQVDFGAGAALQLFGEPLRLPRRFAFDAGSDGFDLPLLRLQGAHGGQLNLAGRIGVSGDTNMVANILAFPFGQLPAIAALRLPLGGQLTGRLRLSRAAPDEALAVAGQLSVANTTFAGRALGAGSLHIVASPTGSLHARGRLIDGVTMDATLNLGPRGLSGEATAHLRELRLAPFLASFPAQIPGWLSAGTSQAAGTVSGTVTARLTPTTAPLVEARLHQLALTFTGPRAPRRTPGKGMPATEAMRGVSVPPAIDVRAAEDVVLSLEMKTGTLRMKPTRFVGNAGSFEIGGEVKGGGGRGAVRGRLNLEVLSAVTAAPTAFPWFDGVSGIVSLDLQGAMKPEDAHPLITGAIGLDAAGTVRLGGTPLPLRIPAGRIDLKPGGIAAVDIPVVAADGTVHLTGGWMTAPTQGAPTARLAVDAVGDLDARIIEALAGRYLRGATGRARLTARLRGTPTDPRVSAQLGVAGIAFSLAGVPTERVRLVAGQIDLDEQGAVLRDVQVHVGARTRVTIGGPSSPFSTPGARLRFEPFRPWSLTQIDVPLQADGVSFAAKTAAIADARLTLRLQGDPRRSLRLSGTVDLVKARLSSRLAKTPGAAPPTKAPPWVEVPRVQQMQLDLHLRSRGGAITVEIPYAPDVRVDLDYQVRGTLKQPQMSGTVRGAGPYSAVAVSLYRLFK